jgi:hypothetical protein
LTEGASPIEARDDARQHMADTNRLRVAVTFELVDEDAVAFEHVRALVSRGGKRRSVAELARELLLDECERVLADVKTKKPAPARG